MLYAGIALYLLIGIAVFAYGTMRTIEKGKSTTFADTLKGAVWCVLLWPFLAAFGLALACMGESK